MAKLTIESLPVLTDLLFEQAEVGLCLVAPDGTILRANRGWLRSTGFALDDVLGADIVALFPDTRDMALAMHARARAGHHVQVPRHAQLVDGRETWWQGSIDPIPMEGGTGLLITAQEVAGGAAPAAVRAQEPLGEGRGLREAYDRLRAHVEATPLGLVEWDADYRVRSLSRRAEEILGWPAAEVLGRRIDEIPWVPEEDWPSVRALMQDMSAGARPASVNANRNLRKDGRIIHCEWYNSAITDRGGRLVSVLSLILDVTGRREAEARTRAIAANVRDLLVVLEAVHGPGGEPVDWRYADANDGALELLGKSRDQLLGRTLGEVFPQRSTALHPALVRVLAGGVPEQYEATVRGRTFLIRLFRIDAHSVGSAAVDITDRKRAEEATRARERELRALADSMPQLAWIARADGFITWYNRRWYEFTGTTPEQMQGWGWQAVHDPAALPEVMVRWTAALAEGKPFEMEFPLRRADGSFRRFLTRAFPLRDDTGRVVQWFGTNTDVTELVEAQEALREADRRKDEFLATLSHELRNPLSPILGATYVLEHADPTGEQVARARSVLRRQGEHLARLVDDLLDVTRITRGKVTLRREVIDAREAVSRAAEDFRARLAERGIGFRVEVPEIAVWLDADPTRLHQVIVNLLHNAAKFTRRGDEVVVALQAIGGAAELRVRDTGAGIDPAVLGHLFEPFVQGERTLARSEGGLGLGLALVKGMIELHGGTVHAASDGAGKGAEFTVRLPLAAAPAAREGGPVALRAHGEGRRVLVVDDNADAAETLADLLRMLGHEVEVAYDGVTALARVRSGNPEVVFCDIGLPGMDGYGVATAVRASGNRSVRLVALSGYAQPEDVRRSTEAGFDAHMAKPPDLDELLRFVQ